MHGLVALFLEVIALAIILLVVGLVVPCVLVVPLTTIIRRGRVGCFDGRRNICGNNAACSLIHGYVW